MGLDDDVPDSPIVLKSNGSGKEDEEKKVEEKQVEGSEAVTLMSDVRRNTMVGGSSIHLTETCQSVDSPRDATHK